MLYSQPILSWLAASCRTATLQLVQLALSAPLLQNTQILQISLCLPSVLTPSLTSTQTLGLLLTPSSSPTYTLWAPLPFPPIQTLRILQIGDASGIQSPLSFGGFGALTRHLGRLTAAVSEALSADCLDRESLSLVHAYNPGLSSAWMLQRAMSVRPGDSPPPNLINRMLR